ncbi:MAG: outer membrane assembly protein [Bacteroidales bacterium]
MTRKRKIAIIAATGLLALVVLLPAAGFAVLYWGVLPSKKLTPLIEREANKYLNGRLTCEHTELTFFETYPFLGIKLTGGAVISYATGDSILQQAPPYAATDSLLAFHEAVISFRLFDYLLDNNITIREISLDSPQFHGYADGKGRANWDILQSPESAATDTFPPVDIQSVKITGGHFDYTDEAAGLYAEVEDFSLNLTGSLLAEGGNTFKVKIGCSAFLFQSPTYSLQNKLALFLKGVVELRDNFNTVTLHDAELRINNLPFTADGSVTSLPETKSLGVNLETALKASDLNDVLAFVPETYFKNKKGLTATGSVSLQAQIIGEVGDSVFPTVDVCCIIEGGAFSMKGVKQGIEALEMDIDLHLDDSNPDLSYASIEKLQMKGLNTTLDVTGRIDDLVNSPAIDACVKGSIDFTQLAKEFLNPDTLLLQGYITGDIDVAFLLDDLANGRYDKVNVSGYLDVDSLKAESKPFDMDVFLSNVHLTVDTAETGANLLRATLQADSADIKYGKEINTTVSRLEMTAQTSPVIDTSAVASIASNITFKRLHARLPDSVWIMAKNVSLQGGVKPSASNKHIPALVASAKIDTLRYFAVPLRTGATFAGSTLAIEALPYRDVVRQRMQSVRRDSALTAGRRVRRTPGDSAAAQSEQSMLRNWEVRGSLGFDRLRLSSRMFPLRMRMEKSGVQFDTNKILFTGARFYAGESDFTLTGEITNIRRAMLRGGTLKGNFNLASDYINCNQLLLAMSRGMQYSEQKMTATETAAVESGNMEQLDAATQTDSIPPAVADTGQLFIVPAYLDMALNMQARKIDYKYLQMEQVEGEVVLRNQSINLKKLEMNSNIGRGNLTMFYTARDAHGATAGLDMNLEGLLVEKLIHLYPPIDSLLPMLRSFEGVLDCQMTATCDIDSTMSVVLPSLNTACFMSGKNMVLLDGETFTEISKNLKFKNKQRNIIDSISVDLAIRDNKIEVFPFLLEMDRYRAAVSGTHYMDMTFNYHFSVLKSPLPFNLGLDITGTLDNFKYKIVKCKYKDSFNPAKEQDLIVTKTNIREGILELIRRQIVENAPELAVRAAPALTDSVSLSNSL